MEARSAARGIVASTVLQAHLQLLRPHLTATEVAKRFTDLMDRLGGITPRRSASRAGGRSDIA
jgi:hypothetical protein